MLRDSAEKCIELDLIDGLVYARRCFSQKAVNNKFRKTKTIKLMCLPSFIVFVSNVYRFQYWLRVLTPPHTHTYDEREAERERTRERDCS